MLLKLDVKYPEHIEMFKELFKAAKKQKDHLSWVYHTLKSFDLRRKNPMKSILRWDGDRDYYLIIEDSDVVGCLVTYNYSNCRICDYTDLHSKRKDECSLWYFVLKEYSGKGYMSKALKEFISTNSYKRIGACVASGNKASERVLLSNWFREDTDNQPIVACYYIKRKSYFGKHFFWLKNK